MDDPLFDPWGSEPESPPPVSAGGGRWRAPAGNTPPTPPATYGRGERRVTGPDGSRPTLLPRARLAGMAGFLRTMSVPRIEEVAQRLQLARHDAVVEDLLDQTPPRIRLTVRPWRGPWTEGLSPPAGVLELELDTGEDEQVIMRIWLDPEADEPTAETSVPPARLGAAWLDAQVLDFVAKLLERA